MMTKRPVPGSTLKADPEKRLRRRKPPPDRRAGKEKTCEYCGETFVAWQDFRTYGQRFCSSDCFGASNRRSDDAYPPREEVEQLVSEGLTDRELGARYGHTYQWALKLRRRYGIAGWGRAVRSARRRGEVPRHQNSSGYIRVDGELEHRLVAAEKLGRPLAPGEVVHHIDGDRANNHPDNLQVFESHSAHMRATRPPKPPRPRTEADQSVYRYFNLKLKGEDTCRNCGAPARHLHHAIPRSVCLAVRKDLRNGLPLCPSCHTRWHQRTLVLYRDVFTEEEWAFLSSVELTGQRIEAWLDDHYPERELEEAAA